MKTTPCSRSTATAPSRCRPALCRLGFCTAVLLTSACAGPAVSPVPAPVPTLQSPGRASITVRDDASGSTVVLDRNQELVVRLPDAVIAGTAWSLVGLKPGVLNLRATGFERPQSSPDGADAAGTRIWRFQPEAAGTLAIQFDLKRPQSVEPAVRSVTYTVTVR